LNIKYYPGYEQLVPGGVLKYLEKLIDNKVKWQCFCKNIFITYISKVTTGSTKSCGCWNKLVIEQKIKDPNLQYLRKKHGEIKQICYNPNDKAYKDYGARGIQISIEWKNNRAKFIKDVINTIGHRPTDKHQLDRVNNSGNYEINNLRWSSSKENCRNRRSNKLITIGEKTKTMAEWSEISGINRGTISVRIKNGWPEGRWLEPVNIFDIKIFDNTNFKNIFYKIRSRCFNVNNESYKDYGGRGITICEEWKNDYNIFQQDILNSIGPRPSSKHNLDRYPNNNGNYESGNVRWATSKENNRNKRNNNLIEIDGEIKTINEWSEISGIKPGAILQRFLKGVIGKDLLKLVIKRKFNNKQIKDIKKLNENGKSISKIAKLYDTGKDVIRNIIRNRGAYFE